MTEKSARNPTPGFFPHTGSAPAAPPVRGQRGATSAERGAEPRGRGAAAEAPAGLRGGGGPGTGGERPGGARRRPPYDRSWRADRGGARPARRSGRAQPRTAALSRAAPTGRPPEARPGGELRAAARPRAATSRRVSRSQGSPPTLPAAAPTGSGGVPPAAPRPRSPDPAVEARRVRGRGQRGGARPEGLFTRAGGGR